MAQGIEIVRGTTNTLEIAITDADGAAYIATAGEKIIFGVKKKATDPDLVFTKVAAYSTPGKYIATISPDDTNELTPGRYCYDVGLQSGDDYFGIIEPNPFTILPNVTERGCAG